MQIDTEINTDAKTILRLTEPALLREVTDSRAGAGKVQDKLGTSYSTRK